MLLVPQLKADEYVGADVDDLLVELHQLRNACVHGKVPFKNMQAEGFGGRSEPRS